MTPELRLFAAFQVLAQPDGAYFGVDHTQARVAVAHLLDLDVTTLPEHNPKTQPTLDGYLTAWLGLEMT